MTSSPFLTLFGMGPDFGLPDSSPFVLKTEIQLKMAGLAYRKQPALPEDSPKGQLPFIEDEDGLVADSTFIRAYLEEKYAVDLDAGLDSRQRAESWAIERMIENHLCQAMSHARWLIPENFAKGPARWFDHAPDDFRDLLRKDLQGRVRTRLFAQGITRHADDEIVELGAKSLAALAAVLGDKRWLLAEHPSAIDATAFGALACILTPFFDSPLRRRAETFPTLTRYVDRMMADYFPDHLWEAQRIGVSLDMRRKAVKSWPQPFAAIRVAL